MISDVHGNLPALDAALGGLRRAGVHRILCLGDLVGYGPFPNACVARVAELDALVVAGNHDLMAVDRLEQHGSPLARATMDWTRSVLDKDASAFLDTLPLQLSVDSDVLMTHGGLGDPRRYVWGAGDVSSELAELECVAPGARLLLLGHTHEPLAAGSSGATQLFLRRGRVALAGNERFVLNPGSVGQSRQWSDAARILVLDLEQRTAHFDAIAYDSTAVREELKRHGLPPETHHRRPPPWRADTARRLRRGLLERSSARLHRLGLPRVTAWRR